jgi:hypothetical protein
MPTMATFFIPIIDHSHSFLWVISWTRWASRFLSVFILLRLFIFLLPRLTPNNIYSEFIFYNNHSDHKGIIISNSQLYYINLNNVASLLYKFFYLLLDLDFFSQYSGCSSYIYLNRLFLNFDDIFFKCKLLHDPPLII